MLFTFRCSKGTSDLCHFNEAALRGGRKCRPSCASQARCWSSYFNEAALRGGRKYAGPKPFPTVRFNVLQ